MKKSLLSMLLVGLLLSRSHFAAAKDAPPVGGADSRLKLVAVVSVASYDRLMSDIKFVGQIAQQPGLEKQAEGMLLFFAQGLNGLDKTRPWGVVVSTDGTNFPRIGFLPVTDSKQLLGSLQGVLGAADDAGNGISVLEKNNLKIYVKEQGGWAFVSDSIDALVELPKDPSKWLGGLDKTFELGIQFHIANVPEMYCSMAIDQLKEGIKLGLQQQEGEDESTYELRQKLIQDQLKSLEDVINDADQFTLGWAIDQENKLTYLDVSMTAKANSDLAKKFGGFKDTPSGYSGFSVPGAAFSVGLSQTMDKADTAQATAAIDALKSTANQEIDKSTDLPDDDTKAAAKAIVGDLLEALKSTVASGKTDGGLSLLLGAKTLTGMLGVYIADTARVESALKKLSELAAKDPNIPKLKFNADKYGDVRFHTAKLPVPPDEDVAKVVGSTLDVVIGIGPKSVYVGVGSEAIGSLKKAIDKSKADASKAIPPGFAIVSVQPILEFANAMEPNPLNGALLAELSKTPAKDHIQLLVKPITNGVTYHLEVQEAVLNLLGVAAKMQGGGPPPGAGIQRGGAVRPLQRVK